MLKLFSFILFSTLPSLAFAVTQEPQRPELVSTVLLTNGCSASLVTLEGRKDSQKALVLTNGHCVGQGSMQGEYPAPGEALYHAQNSSGNEALLFTKTAGEKVELKITELLYATMTGTDLGLYLLDETYSQIEKKTGIKPFTLVKDGSRLMTPGQNDRRCISSALWPVRGSDLYLPKQKRRA